MASSVSKYAHIVAFHSAYPKCDAEMWHNLCNLEYWVKSMKDKVKPNLFKYNTDGFSTGIMDPRENNG